MKLLLKIVLALLLAVVVMFGIQIIASESGEVVVLTTTDAAGATYETRLWIVELNGQRYLRAGSEKAGWFQHLSVQPDVELARTGTLVQFRAQPSVDQRAEINDLMQQKYGWADTLIGWIYGREDAVPVQLVSVP